MAGKDINIPITGDAREFIRATGDVEGALDDVADALDDISRETKRGMDKSADSIEDMGKEFKDTERDIERAGKAVEDLEDSFRDVAKRAKDLGDDGDDAGKKIDKGMERAEDGVKEMGDEANSTAKEAAASFDGSAESIADAFQEVAANAFAGFGPAGAIAGLAAAAGIGLAMAGFDKIAEEEEKRKESVMEWAEAYKEAGRNITDTVASLAAIESIYGDQEKYDEAVKNAENWQVTLSTAVNAMAGDKTALEIVNDNLTKSEEEVAAALETAGGDARGLTYEMRQLKDQTSQGTEAQKNLTQNMKDGKAIADAEQESFYLLATSVGVATGKTDELGNSIITMPDGKEVVIDAQTRSASEDLDAFKTKTNGLPDGYTKVNVNTSDATRAVGNWISQNNGRTIKIYGKYISPAGSSIP